MDARDFFDSFIRLNEKLEDLENSFIEGVFSFDNSRENIRPRDLMLKKNPLRKPITDTKMPLETINRPSRSFSGQFKPESNFIFEEKIVMKDGSGTEKIITKHSDGINTIQKETLKKDDQILSEQISDIIEDTINFDGKRNDEAKQQNQGWTNTIRSYVWPF